MNNDYFFALRIPTALLEALQQDGVPSKVARDILLQHYNLQKGGKK
jgi:hypothetical protein